MTLREKEKDHLKLLIFDEYMSFYDDYKQKYGDQTCILMQVGSFFEIYGVENEKIKLGNVYEIGNVLNIQVSRRDKKEIQVSHQNYLMAGFPTYRLDNHVPILLENSYHVVIIEQFDNENEKKKTRKVTKVYSPGTYIDYNKSETNTILSLYIEEIKSKLTTNHLFCIGLSLVNLSTGKLTCYEFSVNDKDNFGIEEIARFVHTYNPIEIFINTKNLENIYFIDKIKENINKKIIIQTKINEIDTNYYKLTYQTTFLHKVYPPQTCKLLSVIEYLDLEQKPITLISLLLIIKYIYDHNESILKKIHKPIHIDKNNQLVIANHAIKQLDLISNDKTRNGSVFNIINETKTLGGKRLLKERLLNPITDITTLNSRYTIVENLVTNNKYKKIETYLQGIVDLEKIHRKIILKNLNPSEFNLLNDNYLIILNFIEFIQTSNTISTENGSDSLTNEVDYSFLKRLLPNQETIYKFKEYIMFYQQTLTLEETFKYFLKDLNGTIFSIGYNNQLDMLTEEMNECNSYFECLARKLSKFIDLQSVDYIKINKNDRNGTYLTCTGNRAKVLQKSIKEFEIEINSQTYRFKKDDFQFINPSISKTESSCNIFSDAMKIKSKEIEQLEDKIKELVNTLYLDFLEKCEPYLDCLDTISLFVSECDVYYSCAKSSILNNYNKPNIQYNSENSFIRVNSIRHPIIEKINTKEPYKTHDIVLGDTINNSPLDTKSNDITINTNGNTNNTDDKTDKDIQSGILLFGINSTGKSSLLKTVAINIILAQAGFFVAATDFIYSPYDYILTRIVSTDNLHKGQSLFTTEISELRTMLQQSNNRSLCICDELCNSTESSSALSIVASTIIELTKKKSNFIFSTHFHKLTEIKSLLTIPTLKFYHLTIMIDYETNKLVYDRCLKKGSGDSIYGLEICQFLGMSHDFMENAFNIRKDILDIPLNFVNPKKSHFNANVYLDKCHICNYTPIKSTDKELEVHHLKEQKCANKNGFIEHMHKNKLENLVVLCRKCHENVHKQQINIDGYRLTNEGIDLKFNKSTNIHSKKIVSIKKKL
jgi:DNA mismatch repair protein MutS